VSVKARRGLSPVKPANDVLKEMPDTLLDHLAYHGDDFESVLVTFTPDGSWFLTGFGNTAFKSMDTVAEVLEEAAELIGTDYEIMH